jgi:hemerythrin-like domain-containing protein
MDGCMSAFPGMQHDELSPGLAQLKGEHGPLREKLAVISSLIENMKNEIDMEQTFIELKNSVAVFKAELDPHSEREEGVLFPMMGKYIGTTSGPIAVMEYEHDQAKSFINAFIEKTENEIQVSSEEMKDSAGLAENAYNILTEHFTKEENVLFPMAERMLSDQEKTELYKRIQEI